MSHSCLLHKGTLPGSGRFDSNETLQTNHGGTEVPVFSCCCLLSASLKPHSIWKKVSHTVQRLLHTDESGVGSIQSEKAGCEEAEKRKEGFPFQIVGVGSERKGGRGNEGIEWRVCSVRGGTPEVPH